MKRLIIHKCILYVLYFSIFSLLASGCATFSLGDSNFNLFTPEDDVKLGRQLFDELKKEHEFVNDTILKSYINQVGQNLAGLTPEPQFQYEFYIVKNDDEVNAFALPGGLIFLNTGMLKVMESEET